MAEFMDWMHEVDGDEDSNALDPLLALADQAEVQATPVTAGMTQKVCPHSPCYSAVSLTHELVSCKTTYMANPANNEGFCA